MWCPQEEAPLRAAREAEMGGGEPAERLSAQAFGWAGGGRVTAPSIPPPPGSQSAAPSAPMLPCSTLIPGCGSSSTGTRCRPRGSPAASTSPGRGLPTLACCFLWAKDGAWPRVSGASLE